MQGQANTEVSSTYILSDTSPPTQPADDDIHVYGNTFYSTGAPSANIILCSNGAGVTSTGHECRDNLVYAPGQSGTRLATSGGGFDNATDNDLRISPVPTWWPSYPSAPPAQGTTDYLDFLGSDILTCDLTASALTRAGAQYGCIVVP